MKKQIVEIVDTKIYTEEEIKKHEEFHLSMIKLYEESREKGTWYWYSVKLD